MHQPAKGDQRAQAGPRHPATPVPAVGSAGTAPAAWLPAEQDLVERLTRAFETTDMAGIVALLTEDA
jgi:hypothetical protein